MVKMVRGSELPARMQAQAMRQYIHRFTGDNEPRWAMRARKDGTPYPLQFKDDDDWLSNTKFPVTKSGKLARRPSYCESSPTWPNNPELRK